MELDEGRGASHGRGTLLYAAKHSGDRAEPQLSAIGRAPPPAIACIYPPFGVLWFDSGKQAFQTQNRRAK